MKKRNARWVTTVGDLRKLIENDPDEAPISVAPTPDINGWTQGILGCVHRDKENGLVLALDADTETEEELDLTFRDALGTEVRPV